MDEKNDSSTMELELSPLRENAKVLATELGWFGTVLNTRISLYFNNEVEYNEIYEIEPPVLTDSSSIYANLVNQYPMSFSERLILILALIPHIKPNMLDIFFTKNESFNRGYTEFGGVNGNFHSGFIPTGETLAFILAGDNLEERFNLSNLFDENHFFFKLNILCLEGNQGNNGEPELSNVLKISDEYLSLLTVGEDFKPQYSTNFPAKPIETKLNWKDLVLHDYVREELDDIITWIEHGNTLMNDWGLESKITRGYRAMFYGPPGTGKTLTACLIGKSLGIDIYRIDLSMIVSKFIGETEKNLANIFDQAENKNWILFFDEADALFGKRTATSSSNDRHANQEVAYLLQRIEDFPGIIILASNLKGNLDDAFSRRFQSMIYFPVPDKEQRLQLWKNAFDHKLEIDPEIDWQKIATDYEISGGSITNVLRHCSIKAIQRDSKKVILRDLITGIKKEHRKEGKG